MGRTAGSEAEAAPSPTLTPGRKPGSAPAAPLVVCLAEGEASAPSRSFSARTRPVALACHDGAVSGPVVRTLRVPRPVARAFGKEPRGFASQEALDAYLEDLVARTAFERVEAALKTHERSAAETVRKLAADGFAPTQAQAAVDRAVRCGLIDDARYAEAFIAAKLRAGWGRTRIERALAQAGVDPRETVEGYPEAFFDRDRERDRARALLARKPVPAKNPVEKLARHLVTKGFDPGMAFSLAREHVEHTANEE